MISQFFEQYLYKIYFIIGNIFMILLRNEFLINNMIFIKNFIRNDKFLKNSAETFYANVYFIYTAYTLYMHKYIVF